MWSLYFDSKYDSSKSYVRFNEINDYNEAVIGS